MLRKAIDVFMSEVQGTSPEDVKKALCYVIPQLNQSVTVKGFSPTQWVLGYQPRIPGLLMDEGLNPSHLEPSLDFKEKLDMRAAAGGAILQADTSNVSKTHFAVGQKVYYYREGSGVGPRIRRKGPAVIAMLEQGKSGRQSVVWIVHGSQLIRAAPEHLRPDLLDEHPPVTPLQALDAVRGRGTTTFMDLTKTNKRLSGRELQMLGSDDEQDEPDSKVARIGSLPPACFGDDPFASLPTSAAPAAVPSPSAILHQHIDNVAAPAVMPVPEDTALPDDASDLHSVSDDLLGLDADMQQPPETAPSVLPSATPAVPASSSAFLRAAFHPPFSLLQLSEPCPACSLPPQLAVTFSQTAGQRSGRCLPAGRARRGSHVL